MTGGKEEILSRDPENIYKEWGKEEKEEKENNEIGLHKKFY